MSCLKILFILIILSEITGRFEEVLDRIAGIDRMVNAAESDGRDGPFAQTYWEAASESCSS